jgi:hypothetical protein
MSAPVRTNAMSGFLARVPEPVVHGPPEKPRTMLIRLNDGEQLVIIAQVGADGRTEILDMRPPLRMEAGTQAENKQ